MTRPHFVFILFTGIILGLGLGGSTSPAQARPTALNLISEIRGNVLLKRSQWQNFKKANVGDLLNVSDQLKLEAGASATILCNNLKIWTVPTNKVTLVSEGCGTSGLTSVQANASLIRTRGDAQLYILSPRNTHIFTERPLFRWSEVRGAKEYTVQLIENGAEPIWQAQTDKTQIEYPGTPAIKPGSRYWLIVKTDNDVSSSEPSPQFKRLTPEKSQSLQSQIQQIQSQNLSSEIEALAIAHLYRVYDVNAEAIALLEDQVKLGKSSSPSYTVYKLLGDSYRQVGLTKESEAAYLQALTLAQQSNDVAAQAEIQYQLGDMQLDLNNLSEAKRLMLEAQKSYQVLGDMAKTQEINQLLQEIGVN
ncbi:MAG: tetratricopeptide repeat protein [Snowella sp.]|nr:tetratricopeptide repeat protein [Snowella sp.]